MKKQFSLSMIASLIVLLSACHQTQNSDGSSSIVSDSGQSSGNLPISTPTPVPSATPVAVATPVDFSTAPFVGSWRGSEINPTGENFYTGSITIGTDGNVQNNITNNNDNSAFCGQTGSISTFSPSVSCSDGSAHQCGTATFAVSSASGDSSCMAVGTYSCTYEVSAAATQTVNFPSMNGFPGFPITTTTPANLKLDCGQGALTPTLIQYTPNQVFNGLNQARPTQP